MAFCQSEEIKIIYEDDHILVLDKPAGWVVTKEKSNNNQKYIEDWIKLNRPNGLLREGIVHRLDKGTSGVLLTAKTEYSLKYLKEQFKLRRIIKHYWALVGGDLPFKGNIKVPIIRSNYNFSKYKVGVDGRLAETEFEVEKKYRIGGKAYSLVKINLKTGRTHQIRVHFSYMGWPLLGDKVYGGEMLYGMNRPFLHAYELVVIHPNKNREIKFVSEIARDLTNVINQFDIYEK